MGYQFISYWLQDTTQTRYWPNAVLLLELLIRVTDYKILLKRAIDPMLFYC